MKKPLFEFDKPSRQRLLVIAAVICFSLAISEIANPTMNPPHRVLTQLIFELCGSYGLAAMHAALGGFCLSMWWANRPR